MSRVEVESELDFVGFIIFENKLKPTTTAVIKELLASDIGAVMVTGDNILTAISVARQCELMDKTAHCFVPRFIQGTAAASAPSVSMNRANRIAIGDFHDPKAELEWESIDNGSYCLDRNTLQVRL